MKLLTANLVLGDVGCNLKNPVPCYLLGLVTVVVAATKATSWLITEGARPGILTWTACLFGGYMISIGSMWCAHAALQPLVGDRGLMGWALESATVLALAASPALVQPGSPHALILASYSWACLLAAWCGAGYNCLTSCLDYVIPGFGFGLADRFSQQWKRQRIDLLLREAARMQPDVVCFQELGALVWSQHHAQHLIAGFRKLGLIHHTASPLRPQYGCQLAGSGHLLLSRFPITHSRWRYFRAQEVFEAPAVSRGFLFAELAVSDGGGPVHIAALHTTSGLDVVLEALSLQRTRLFKGTNAAGLAQALEAAATLVQEVGGALPLTARAIVCGDFNICPGTAAYAVLAGYMREAGLQDTFCGKWEPTFGIADANGAPAEWLMTQVSDQATMKTVDYVWSNRPTVAQTVERLSAPRDEWGRYQAVSDHAGLCVSF